VSRQDPSDANVAENIRIGSEALGRPEVVHMGWTYRMIPAFTFRHPLLSRRFGTERVMLTTTTAPVLYRSLLTDFFRTGQDFFVSYFHADELVAALGDWRRRLDTFRNLRAILLRLAELADRKGYEIHYVTIGEIAEILFGEHRSTMHDSTRHRVPEGAPSPASPSLHRDTRLVRA
jgi:hypothetical protein